MIHQLTVTMVKRYRATLTASSEHFITYIFNARGKINLNSNV